MCCVGAAHAHNGGPQIALPLQHHDYTAEALTGKGVRALKGKDKELGELWVLTACGRCCPCLGEYGLLVPRMML
jgi:hypothetical protein